VHQPSVSAWKCFSGHDVQHHWCHALYFYFDCTSSPIYNILSIKKLPHSLLLLSLLLLPYHDTAAECSAPAMEHFLLIVAALTAGLNAAISIYVFWRFRKFSSNKSQKLYEDHDGTATDDSHTLYLTSTRIIKSVTTAVWAIGFLVSVATAISRTVHTERTQVTEAWLTFACWVGQDLQFLPP